MKGGFFTVVLGLCCLCLQGHVGHADDRIAVAVSYFENTSKDAKLEPLKKGLAEMLITDLSISRDIRLVERERLNDVLKEIALQKSPYMDQASAAKLGKGLGAAFILTGSYIVSGETMRVDCRVVDVESSAVVIAVKAEGASKDFMAIERDLSAQLLQAISGSVGLAQKKRIGAGSTGNLDALAAFSDGLDALDAGDALLAAKALKKALSEDPDFKAAQQLKSRVDAMAAAYDLSIYEAQVDRVGRYLAGNECACSYTKPLDEIAQSSHGTRLGHRLWEMKGTQSTGGGKTLWIESLRVALDFAELGQFEMAEAFLDASISEDFVATGLRNYHGGTIPDGPQTAMMARAAKCVAYQVRSYAHLVQLELDEAMAWQAKAAGMPDYAFKNHCLSGMQLQALGMGLDKPLKAQIQDTMDDPEAFLRRKDQLRVINTIAPKAWAQVQTMVDDAPSCEELCPWSQR